MITHDFIILSAAFRTVLTTKIRSYDEIYKFVRLYFHRFYGCWVLDIDTGIRYQINDMVFETLSRELANGNE